MTEKSLNYILYFTNGFLVVVCFFGFIWLLIITSENKAKISQYEKECQSKNMVLVEVIPENFACVEGYILDGEK